MLVLPHLPAITPAQHQAPLQIHIQSRPSPPAQPPPKLEPLPPLPTPPPKLPRMEHLRPRPLPQAKPSPAPAPSPTPVAPAAPPQPAAPPPPPAAKAEPSAAPKVDEIANYTARTKAAVYAVMRIPPIAKALNLSAHVPVEVTLQNGKLLSSKLLAGDDVQPFFIEAAKQALAATQWPAPPAGLADKRITLTIDLFFHLHENN